MNELIVKLYLVLYLIEASIDDLITNASQVIGN